MSLLRSAASALAAAAAVRAVGSLPARRWPGGSRRWERTNHAGRTVSLVEGPAVVAGTIVAARSHPALAALAATSGGLGLLDDMLGGDDGKGLRGHLDALRSGKVTTGAVKVLGLGVSGLATAAWLDQQTGRGRAPLALASTLAGGALIAGSANLINLFDLRPGRALKVTLVPAALAATAGDEVAAGLVGAVLAAAPEDLAGQRMLGDTGANALGAVLGAIAVRRLSGWSRWGLLGTVTAATLASEKVSFSAVIDANPVLHALDTWGRRTS
ncbi:hypothetical protein ACMYYO_08730 [Dermacoccaceae bacterium W4C1]